jgi:chemotaxis methyl-accepting protein methylase
MSRVEPAEWKLVTDLIEERFGLTFDGVRGEILQARLQPRLRVHRLDSLRSYYHFLRYHPDGESELSQLGGRLTNNETTSSASPIISSC